jgi:hypothetical protein
MEKRKKILLGVLIAIGLLLLLGIGVNVWVKTQLPKLLNKQSDTYAIAYKDIDIAVFRAMLTLPTPRLCHALPFGTPPTRPGFMPR